MAAGFGDILPVTTLGCMVSDIGTDRVGRNDDLVQHGFRILISQVGRHTLASPKGGGSCSLGTHNLRGCNALGLLTT